MFAGAFDGIYISTDLGSTWTKTGEVKADIICMKNNGTVLFTGAGNKGLYSTHDDGVSWFDCNIPYVVTALAVSGSNLYAGTELHGILKSANDGNNWEPANTGLNNGSLSIRSLFTSNQYILAGTDDRIYISNNGGASWNPAGSGMPDNTSVRAIVTASSFLFAATNRGMYISMDNAITWNQQNAGLSDTNVLTAIVIGSSVFAGTFSGGVFKSMTHGTDWTQTNTGLGNLKVKTLTFHGSDIFAGTGHGVFLSRDSCAHWKDISTGLQDSAVNSLFISGEFLYAGPLDDGIWKRPLTDFLAIEEKRGSDPFKLYPNPAANSVWLYYHVSGQETGLTLSIYLANGQEIRSYPLPVKEERFAFDVSDLKPGIYFYTLRNDSFSGGLKKLIVIR
jgi:hypothetical protein